MGKEKVTQKGQEAKAPKKAKGPKYPDKSNPPKVEAGMKAVWHDTYSYTNAKDNVVTIQGHYEVIKETQKPPKVEKKVEESAAES